jgi:methylmalonyl-CoA carboxyltransferase 12S subunit
MTQPNDDLERILQAIEGLRESVDRLQGRVARLEAERRRGPASQPGAEEWRDAGAAETPHAPAAIDVEMVMTIAAAVAAYLGKKPHIRSIRLVGSEAWAQQGRATIQAAYSVSANPLR